MKFSEIKDAVEKKIRLSDERTRKIIFVVFGAFVFILGMIIGGTIIEKPVNDEQFAYLEQVAEYVYSQGNKVIYEAPKELDINKTETTIEVSYSRNYAGKAVARVSDGKLVIERDKQIPLYMFLNLIWGAIFFLIFFNITILISLKIKDKKNKKEQEKEKQEYTDVDEIYI